MGAPSCIPLIPLYTGRQIRQAEAPLLEAGHRETLMRRAAYGLAQAVLERLRAVRGSVYGAKVTGLIGSGNNGGDGLYALAMLRRRGVETHAVMMRDRAHEAGTRAFLAAGGRLVDVVDTDTDALIDAIIGTGSRVGFEMPRIPGLDEVLADESTQVIACDIPSGVDVETGAVAGDVIDADVTVTFGGIKSGLALGEGSHAAGEIRAVDIGLGATLPTPARWLVGDERLRATTPDAADTPAPLSRPRVSARDHKYSRGVLHVIAGSVQFPGAAQLTATAAVTSGVGMVTLQAPEEVRERLSIMMPEVVTTSGKSTAVLERATAAAIGPGISRDVFQIAAMGRAVEWAGTEHPCVIDASALANLDDEYFADEDLGPNVLLTPHYGELRRVMTNTGHEDLGEVLDRDPATAVEQLAARLNVTVLLKGPSTIIAAPQGPTVVHRVHAPGLATAGSGDVLTGIIGALAAVDPQAPMWRTAALGVRLHAEAAKRLDPYACGAFGAGELLSTVAPTR
ncbi:NAD(P)H-hydrate dehydratase [Nesterenkonia sp. CL21]|uniref:NAD(P)H-hydrate dehydratase n=1 Tax=Nesterenkonia sp. CL21 TaxID=3064894 RepID=UPI002879E031|nr:NAD(P)H-hydrate dehydratase [Nesterenkonia sp. CL21]MDS2172073.1 NAD(P)H-hydrate dehydratase [Nesterenkonia sp. CL21]